MLHGVPVRFRPEVQSTETRNNSGFPCFLTLILIDHQNKTRNKTRNTIEVKIVKKPYSIPKLHIPRDDRGKPIVKGGDWFVWFRYEGQKHPLKYRKDLNRIPTYRERKKVGQALAQV